MSKLKIISRTTKIQKNAFSSAKVVKKIKVQEPRGEKAVQRLKEQQRQFAHNDYEQQLLIIIMSKLKIIS